MEYHQDRFVDYSLMVYRQNELMAILPANVSKGILYSHQGLSYGGLLLSESIGFKDVLEAFKAILQHCCERSLEVLHLKLLPKIYHVLPSDEMDYIIFKLKATIARRDLSSSLSYRNLLQVKSSNRKRGLKKALKNDVIIKEVESFDEFWIQILIPNLKSTHGVFPVHSLEEISLLKNKFLKQIRQFNAYKDGDIIAGVTIFETKNVAHAQYISADKNKEYSGLDLLFNHLINDVFIDKEYFDFGISNEDNGERINQGLMEWKESYGARSIVHDFYEIDTSLHKNLDDI